MINKLKVNIRPSRHLVIVLALGHAAAAATCLIVDIPVPVRLMFLLAIAASCAHALHGPALLRASDSITSVELGEGGDAAVQTRRGNWRAAKLCDSTYVGPYLTVLSLKTDGNHRTRHVVIMPDSLEAEDFRQLRVWLRWRKSADQ